MPNDEPDEVTADQAKDELGITTRAGVVYLIRAGQLPGSRKLDPTKPTSPWLIPTKAIQALLKKRAQSTD